MFLIVGLMESLIIIKYVIEKIEIQKQGEE